MSEQMWKHNLSAAAKKKAAEKTSGQDDLFSSLTNKEEPSTDSSTTDPADPLFDKLVDALENSIDLDLPQSTNDCEAEKKILSTCISDAKNGE